MSFINNGITKLWEDPAVVGINKLPGRSSHRVYPDAGSALRRSENPWELCLDGVWDFHPAPNPVAAEAVASGRGKGVRWQSINVPGHPEMQGHGRPHYTNIQMPFAGEPPRVPVDNQTGVFRRSVKVPAPWRGLRVVLHFGSAESFLAVWVNGAPVGVSKGSRLPAEFDVTALVEAGRRLEICVLTAKWSDASFIEDQDMWWLSGLPRSVKLFATPHVHPGDVFVRPSLDTEGGGCLDVEVNVGTEDVPAEPVEVALQGRDPQGRPILRQAAKTTAVWSPNWVVRDRGVAKFSIKVPRCSPWSHETPALYTAEISVGTGRQKSFTAVRFGFRRVEVRDGQLLINGRRVLIFGVNRHSYQPAVGRAVSREQMRKDVALIKKHHFNAVRCAHYPPDPYWLELCDEHGLYVIDEADIEAHAFYHSLCLDPRYAGAWLDRVTRMVLRDKNHPSIIAWSLGNESGYGPSHDAAAGWVRHYDPSRPLHYEGAVAEFPPGRSPLDGIAATDLICPMYPSIATLREREAQLSKLARQPRGADQPLRPCDRPIILCEYSHAMGNSNGSLSDYFDLFRSSRRIQGGFIWEWADHGIPKKTADGREFYAYGGDFGDEPNDSNFVCDGLVHPDRRPHPAMEEHRYLAQPLAVRLDKRGFLSVENRQSFTGTGWLRGDWSMLVDGVERKRGRLVLPACAPGKAVRVKLPVALPAGREEILLNFRWVAAPAQSGFQAGEEVGRDQVPLRLRRRRAVPVRRNPAVRHEKAADRFFVETDLFRASWSRVDGRLLSLDSDGGALLSNGPRPELWRAAVDNDGIKLWQGQERKPLGRWRALGLDRLEVLPGRPCFGLRGGVPVLTLSARLTGRGRPQDARWRTVVRFDALDSFLVEHVLEIGSPDLIDLPRVGATWVTAPGLDHLRYYGRGPHENYSDRQRSAFLGVHRGRVEDEYFPYVMPQETGHHCGLRWLELRGADGRGVRFDFPEPLEANALHFTAEDLYRATHTTDLQPRPEVFLTIDAGHRGVGTGSCGPDTLPEYRLSDRSYRWVYRVSVLEVGSRAPELPRLERS